MAKSALVDGGCKGGDIPYGSKPYFDHSSFIAPYTSPSQISFSDSYWSLMQLRLDQFIKITTEAAPPTIEFQVGDFPTNWVFYGSAGRALTFWKLYLDFKGRDQAKSEEYLNLAKEYIDGSLERLRYDQ